MDARIGQIVNQIYAGIDDSLYDKELAMNLVNDLCEKKCIEQKEICAKKAQIGSTGIGISLDSIKNAPLATDSDK